MSSSCNELRSPLPLNVPFPKAAVWLAGRTHNPRAAVGQQLQARLSSSTMQKCPKRHPERFLKLAGYATRLKKVYPRRSQRAASLSILSSRTNVDFFHPAASTGAQTHFLASQIQPKESQSQFSRGTVLRERETRLHHSPNKQPLPERPAVRLMKHAQSEDINHNERQPPACL